MPSYVRARAGAHTSRASACECESRAGYRRCFVESIQSAYSKHKPGDYQRWYFATLAKSKHTLQRAGRAAHKHSSKLQWLLVYNSSAVSLGPTSRRLTVSQSSLGPLPRAAHAPGKAWQLGRSHAKIPLNLISASNALERRRSPSCGEWARSAPFALKPSPGGAHKIARDYNSPEAPSLAPAFRSPPATRGPSTPSATMLFW